MDLVCIQDEKLMLVGIVLGSDSDLRGNRGVDQTLTRCPIEHRPVVKLSAILIGIGMRIKMNQGELPMHRVVCSQ